MKYTVTRPDGRFSYRAWFEYYIGFPKAMANRQGPVRYNDALKWFRNTYGCSAEIRDYSKMQKWTAQVTSWLGSRQIQMASGILEELPDHCNPHWSWTNG